MNRMCLMGWRGLLAGMVVGAACLPAMAQAPESLPRRYVSRHWTVSDGLPVNSINDLAQTPDGYLWLATWDGLVRFDGARFHVFTAADTDSLLSSRISLLYTDRSGNLWIVTEQRDLVRYRDGTFTPFGPHNGLPAPLTGPSVHITRAFLESADATLWLGTMAGVSRYHEGRMQPFLPDRITQPVTGIAGDPQGDLWFSTAAGTVHRVWRDGSIRTYTTADGLTGGTLFAVVEDAAGGIWVAGEGGIRRLRGDRFEPVTAYGRALTRDFDAAYVDPAGRPWFETPTGVTYRVEGDRLRYVVHPDSLPHARLDVPANPWQSLFHWRLSVDAAGAARRVVREGRAVFDLPEETALQAFFEDAAGNAWIGTNDGLFHLRPALFTVWTRPGPALNGETRTNVYPIVQDRTGAVWLGTLQDDLLRIAGDAVEVWNTETKGFGIGHPWTLHEDRSGRLWAGGYGICQIQPRRPDCVSPEMRLPDVGEVRALYQDTRGRFWVGGEEGLARWDGQAWQAFDDETEGIPHRWVRAIHETRDGTLWFGTNGGGVFRYHPDETGAGRFEAFSRDEGFCSNLVRAFYEDADGYLWAATEDRGVCRLAHHTAAAVDAIEVVSISVPQGLFENGVHVILEDDFGRVWMSTNRGIFWVPRADLNDVADGKETRVFPVTYDERDGLLEREANGGVQPAGLTDRQGRLWFATQNGAAMVDPAQLAVAAPPRHVIIEGAQTAGHLLDLDGGVHLSPTQRDLTITYTVPHFVKPDAVRFQYRLLGQNEAWFDAGPARQAPFTNLGPGRFTFQVRTLDSRGRWDDDVGALVVTRAPTFRETPWFLLLLALTAGLALLAGVRYRSRQIRQRTRLLEHRVAERTRELEAALTTVAEQAEALKSLDAAKSRFFANVSHEFRTPLTLVIGPLRSLLDGQYGALPEAVAAQHRLMLRNSRRLLRLVNQILDLARLDMGTVRLRAQQQDLVAFTEGVVEAFRPLARRHGIALTFAGPPRACPLYFDAQHVEVVLLNLLSNAFKFTPSGGAVSVTLADEADHVALAVADTGKGIAPDALPHVFDRFYQEEGSQGTGIGLSLVRELVELHRGRVTVESTEGRGTTFTLRLPKGIAHLDASEILPDPPDAAPPDAHPAPEPPSILLDADPDAAPAPDASDDEDVPAVLVVDDNPDVRHYLRALLAPSYRVLEAADGEAAMQAVGAHLPDLIVSDVMMPRRDGFAFSRALKADPMTAHIPLLLLTAKASQASTLEGLDTGADDYLTKPFDPAELQARVRNQLAMRRRLRTRYQDSGEGYGTAPDAPQPDTPAPDTLEARARAVVRAHLGDPSFSVQDLAGALHLTYATFNRRLAAETGTTPNAFIRQVRLEEAAALLREGAGSVSEVAYGVGFNQLSYFSRCFREHFGVLPSDFTAAGGDAVTRPAAKPE